MTRTLPTWVAMASYLAIALLAGISIGIVIAPMPNPLVVLTCPAPVHG